MPFLLERIEADADPTIVEALRARRAAEAAAAGGGSASGALNANASGGLPADLEDESQLFQDEADEDAVLIMEDFFRPQPPPLPPRSGSSIDDARAAPPSAPPAPDPMPSPSPSPSPSSPLPPPETLMHPPGWDPLGLVHEPPSVQRPSSLDEAM